MCRQHPEDPVLRDKRTILQGVRILVVEDEIDTRDLLGIVLQSHGAAPILAESVPEALRALNQHPLDVIVTDIGMPGYNGYAFIAAVRNEERTAIRNIPVIALTAYASAADRDTALLSGFNEYLAKPFAPGELIAAIKNLYDRHHRERAA